MEETAEAPGFTLVYIPFKDLRDAGVFQDTNDISFHVECVHICFMDLIIELQPCCMCDQQRLRPDCAYAQSDQSLCYSHEYFMSLRLLTEQHLLFLSLKGSCTGPFKSTLVKIPNCWKSHFAAHICRASQNRPTQESMTRKCHQRRPYVNP